MKHNNFYNSVSDFSVIFFFGDPNIAVVSEQSEEVVCCTTQFLHHGITEC